MPVMAQTCPAVRKPSTLLSGSDKIASIAGGTVNREVNMEKFGSPRRMASFKAMRWTGAVVSKPIAKNTISLSGFSSASDGHPRAYIAYGYPLLSLLRSINPPYFPELASYPRKRLRSHSAVSPTSRRSRLSRPVLHRPGSPAHGAVEDPAATSLPADNGR